MLQIKSSTQWEDGANNFNDKYVRLGEGCSKPFGKEDGWRAFTRDGALVEVKTALLLGDK